jgi:hypothetical protein
MKRTIPAWMWAGVAALLALTVYSAWNSRQLGEKIKAANERATPTTPVRWVGAIR